MIMNIDMDVNIDTYKDMDMGTGKDTDTDEWKQIFKTNKSRYFSSTFALFHICPLIPLTSALLYEDSPHHDIRNIYLYV